MGSPPSLDNPVEGRERFAGMARRFWPDYTGRMSARAKQHWTPPARPDEPCPCGSGKPFASCCDVPGRLPLLHVFPTSPPGPKTGHSNQRCYMRSSADCSEKISGEHYISAAILDEFSELRTYGLPFFGPGETRVGRNALRSNILCTRHNSALSPLDEEGRRTLVAIRDGLNHVWRKSLSRRTLHRIVSGDALELWGVKTLMGLLMSNVARTDGGSTLDAFQIDDAFVTRILTTGRLPPGCGLYVGHDSDLLHDTIGFAPITHQAGARVSGLRVSLLGIVLDFLIDPDVAAILSRGDDPHFRPSILDLQGVSRRARIIVTRADQHGDPTVLTMQVRRSTASGAEASDLAERFARRDFERVPSGAGARRR